ncbi:MAG: ABC transporter ATP-binding protein, partial [Bacteroidales bacterium]|nr:ABC transporter ATP-binding protein [Bacteroidales bacterium]
PTNHMDIKSKDILKQALKAYDGTLLIVSHDRDFLDGLVDKMYEFRDGKVKEHLESIGEFLERRKMESLHELERRYSPQQTKSSTAQKEKSPATDYSAMKEQSRQETRKRNRIKALETSIAEIEGKMKDIEKILSSPGENDDIMELTRSYLELKRDLEPLEQEWGSLI